MTTDTGGTSQLRRALERLWSSADQDRQEAKDAIRQLGSDATPTLLDMLSDLIEGRYVCFPTGMEAEGREALRMFQSRLKGQQELQNPAQDSTAQSPATGTESRGAMQEVTGLSINHRLLFDVVELLGDLRAVAAIPRLIQMLESERGAYSVMSAPNMRGEMIALCKIGPPAVQALIELIGNAGCRGPSAVVYAFGPYLPSAVEYGEFIKAREADEYPAGGEDDLIDQDDSEQEEDWSDILTQRLVARGAMVLGKIGDQRALPVLKELLAERDLYFGRRYVEEAIRSIEGAPESLGTVDGNPTLPARVRVVGNDPRARRRGI